MSNDEPIAAERLAVASLAVQLLPSGASTSTDASDVSRAVEFARQILEATKIPRKQHAFDLFSRDQTANAEEISSIFSEHDWPGLRTKKTVLKYIRNLLAALFRDIGIRRSILEAALRQHAHGPDLPTAVDVATNRIKSLFGELGLDTAFGPNFDDVAELFAYDLIEEGLKASRNLGQEIDDVRLSTPALFNKMCVQSGYLEYAALRAPPSDLGLENLADIIIYMNGPLRERLHQDECAEDFLNVLLTLDPWPEYLWSHTQRKKTPFAECIALFHRKPEDREGLTKLYDMGVRRFCSLWTALQLKELGARLTTDSLVASVDTARTKWTNLPHSDRGEISERFIEEPAWIIRIASNFLRGEAIPDLMGLPFDGNDVRSPLYKSYSKSLVSLFRIVEELNELGMELDLDLAEGCQKLEEKLRMEQTRVRELDLQMKDPDHLTETTMQGQRLVELAISREFDPGKIKPHLLFHYAYNRDLFASVLTR
jgi:hypothetical protein